MKVKQLFFLLTTFPLSILLSGCGRSSEPASQNQQTDTGTPISTSNTNPISPAMPNDIFVTVLNQKGLQMIMSARNEVQKFVQNGGDPAISLESSRKMFSPEAVTDYKTMGMTSAQIAYMQLAALSAIENAGYTGAMFSSGAESNRVAEVNKLRNDCYNAYTNAFAVFLADPGADLNWRDWKGMTFLMNTAMRGQTDLVKALIAKQAKLDVRSNEGKTAAEYAEDGKHDDVVKLLQAAGAQSSN